MAENLSMALAELLRKADAEPDLDTLRECLRVTTPSADRSSRCPSTWR